jgi:ketosteroid isomerase-like protein
MKRTLAALLVLLVTPPLAAGQTSGILPAPASADEQALREIDQQTLEAVIKNDRSFFDGLWIEGAISTDKYGRVKTKAEVLRHLQPAPSDVKYMFRREDVEVHVYGDTAIVSGRTVGPISLPGGQTIQINERSTDTYTRKGGKWLLVATHVSDMPAERAVAKIDPKVYDSYVGRYRLTPSLIFVITNEGGKLMGQATTYGKPSGEKRELLPASETTFFTRQDGEEMVFVRGYKGKVTHVIFRNTNGKEFKVTKIK